MGRLLFMIFVAVVLVFIVMVINTYLNHKGGSKKNRNSRENFDAEIEEVAKKLKKRH